MDETSKEKSLRVVKYLSSLSSLRTKPVCDIRQYPYYLWMNEVPHVPDISVSNENLSEEASNELPWMEILKYDAPEMPEIPESCRQWLDVDTLGRSGFPPELLNVIPGDNKPENATENEGIDPVELEIETQLLENHPSIKSDWDTWITRKWGPWDTAYRNWQKEKDAYARLFSIYFEQQKHSEEYELVMGVGLLVWQTPSGKQIHRHLLTTKASLSFDPHLGKFSITASDEGTKPDIELDMLDTDERPKLSQKDFNELIENAGLNFLDSAITAPVLTAIVNSLTENGDGQYYDDFEPPENSPNHIPRIYHAPALILRKRSVRALEQVLDSIHGQIAVGETLPPEFAAVCEIASGNGLDSTENSSFPGDRESEVFFPKPSNPQQQEIVHRLQNTTGVVVQGPPGTGKSHTIANLICHFLAKGLRVLVTAKSPRALQVLRNHLPEAVRPLCINLLGSGLEEQRALEESVSSTLNRHDNWCREASLDKIERSEKQYRSLMDEKARIDVKIRELRASETAYHRLECGPYCGTAAEIARQLNHESNFYDWFTDRIDYDREFSIDLDETTSLLEGMKEMTHGLLYESDKILPNHQTELPTAEEFDSLVREEKETSKKKLARLQLMDDEWAHLLRNSDLENIRLVHKAVAQFRKAVQHTCRDVLPWVEEAVHDILSDRKAAWHDLLRVLREKVDPLKKNALDLDHITVTAPEGIDRETLLRNAESLHLHFSEGGFSGWWIFKPEIVRKFRYILENVTMNGVLCNTAESLQALVNYLTCLEDIDYCWNVWEGRASRKLSPVLIQVAELDSLNEQLETALSLVEQMDAAEEAAKCVGLAGEISWNDMDTIETFCETCQVLEDDCSLAKIRSRLDRIVEKLHILSSNPKAHPMVVDFLEAIENRNCLEYKSLLIQCEQKQNAFSRLSHTRDILKKISIEAPKLTKKIEAAPLDKNWESRLRLLESAWNWSRARSWLQSFIDDGDTQALENRAWEIENAIHNTMAELSAEYAWNLCFDRMKDEHRQHLMAWQQAVRKTGKGTGRHAHKHIRDARRHLEVCREAIPAWIMPVHRVYETIPPSPGTFDIVIVDEASQCGTESLPLTWYGKRLLIVGDEQQISPEAVGVNRDPIHRLLDTYLSDFKHQDAFDVETSLFDHSKRRFGSRVVLREHFRCMPEIIGFSNRLSYNATPLIPLRQYPPERLEPLRRMYVTDAKLEGSGRHVINRPEAEALVSTVLECCRDERYDGKTMGIIILQGESQAGLIEGMLLDSLGAEELEERRLICGSPHTFQGDERDIIFLSMVAAPNKRIGTLTKTADKQRFNVAASRARDQMWLFHSVTRKDLSNDCLRIHLLDYFENPPREQTNALEGNFEKLNKTAENADRKVEKPPEPFESWFELDLALDLTGKGYRIVPKYVITDNHIDMVIEGAETRLAVTCDSDSWDGPKQFEKDVYSQRMLERCGWRFIRIRESAYYANPDSVLKKFENVLNDQGIYPANKQTDFEPFAQFSIKESKNNEYVAQEALQIPLHSAA